MNRAAGLLQGTRRLTAFTEVRAVHVPNEESIHIEKHKDTGFVGMIKKQVNKIGNDRTHALYGDYPAGNVSHIVPLKSEKIFLLGCRWVVPKDRNTSSMRGPE
ncbi:unnamed protein product [Cylicostephanus goldi]|uniref:Uncharacterized protein n=1 Tax=Cylicostephanus goldi TaxID=71465 RepID=A0A3P6RPN2_CYLGO|nr:unnamed protein product [Cylicostephanus goldi]